MVGAVHTFMDGEEINSDLSDDDEAVKPLGDN